MYEISRESFKQRLEDRNTFIFIHVCSEEKDFSLNTFKDSKNLLWNKDFSLQLENISKDKKTNLLFYTLTENHDESRKAAELAAASGHEFVYFYLGTPSDKLLDQGLN
jgi:hypothetical protein